MKRLVGLFSALAILGSAGTAAAQVDPRAPLWDLIAAFQNCGPPQTYQMLSPQLFQTIAAQTGGRGCYADIAAAGPVIDMQVIGQQRLPAGTVSAIRVTHQSGPVDWFIGMTDWGVVEILTFQAAGSSLPSVSRGPQQPQGGANPPSQPSGSSNPGPSTGGGSAGSDSDGCRLYPSMC